MNPTLLMMITALFPDYAEIRFVPWREVRIPYWEAPDFSAMYHPGDPEATTLPLPGVEHIQLEPITAEGDVLAGMSKNTHVVFISVDGM